MTKLKNSQKLKPSEKTKKKIFWFQMKINQEKKPPLFREINRQSIRKMTPLNIRELQSSLNKMSKTC